MGRPSWFRGITTASFIKSNKNRTSYPLKGYLMENRVSYHFLKFLFATSEWVDENLLETLSEQELSAVSI